MVPYLDEPWMELKPETRIWREVAALRVEVARLCDILERFVGCKK